MVCWHYRTHCCVPFRAVLMWIMATLAFASSDFIFSLFFSVFFHGLLCERIEKNCRQVFVWNFLEFGSSLPKSSIQIPSSVHSFVLKTWPYNHFRWHSCGKYSVMWTVIFVQEKRKSFNVFECVCVCGCGRISNCLRQSQTLHNNLRINALKCLVFRYFIASWFSSILTVKGFVTEKWTMTSTEQRDVLWILSACETKGELLGLQPQCKTYVPRKWTFEHTDDDHFSHFSSYTFACWNASHSVHIVYMCVRNNLWWAHAHSTMQVNFLGLPWPLAWCGWPFIFQILCANTKTMANYCDRPGKSTIYEWNACMV